MVHTFFKYLLLMFPLLVAPCMLLADMARDTSQPKLECDTLFLTNGKIIEVKNLRRTDTEVLFCYCRDSSGKVQRAPIQQLQAKQRQSLDQIPHVLQNTTSPTLEDRIVRLALLSFLGIFPLPVLTQIYLIRKAKQLKKKTENKKNRNQLTALLIINWFLLSVWLAFFAFVLLIFIAFAL
jgi:hypothetical protein